MTESHTRCAIRGLYGLLSWQLFQPGDDGLLLAILQEIDHAPFGNAGENAAGRSKQVQFINTEN